MSGADPEPFEEERNSERFRTQASVGVRRSGSVAIPGTVMDISATGFRIEALERLPLGTTVWLKIGNLAPQMARVVWNKKLVAGCQFSTPLHPTILAELLKGAA